MAKSVYIGTVVCVDISDVISEIDTEDLSEELKKRGLEMFSENENINKLKEIYELRRTGKSFYRELDDYIYSVLGRIV